jgi:hypothetical protein
LSKSLRNTCIGTSTVVIFLAGFYLQFVIINQSQATIKYTLNLSLSGIGYTNSITLPDNKTQSFHVINDSHSLTESYQKEIGKWQSKQYNNKTMVLLTDKYLPQFQKLVSRAQALQPSTIKYLQAKELYIKSLQSEIGSYMHFRNFLATGSKTEDNISTQLLSNALKYEINSFTAFNNRTVTDTGNNNSYGNGTFLPHEREKKHNYRCILHLGLLISFSYTYSMCVKGR